MKNRIFRDSSLQKLSSPDQLDSLMTVTTSRSWLALIGTGSLIIAGLLWSIFGSMTVQVYGHGILLPTGGIRTVSHTSSGVVSDIKIQMGDMIRPGDIITRLDQPDLLALIYEEMEQLGKAKLVLDRTTERDPKRVAVLQEISDRTKRLERLRESLEAASWVVSPFSGRVAEIKISRGTYLSAGMPVASIEIESGNASPLEVVLFVAAEEGKKIAPGMEVQIAPTTVKKEEYGFLSARVTSVSELPVTMDGMVRSLGSAELAQKFSGTGAPVEVHADLVIDGKTVSGYKWSSPGGPPLKINSGTICTGSIILKRIKPISMLLPGAGE